MIKDLKLTNTARTFINSNKYFGLFWADLSAWCLDIMVPYLYTDTWFCVHHIAISSMMTSSSLHTCRIFPLHSVTGVADTKENKTFGRNGSPFDFLCCCGATTEGWACDTTAQCQKHPESMYMSTSECLHVLSGGPGGVCVRACVY